MTTQNVDNAEIAKFSQQAATWWDPNGELKTLHDINSTRLAFIKQHSELTGKAVLDVGCGGGILTESLALAGAITTGLDLSQDALAVAREHAKQQELAITYVGDTVEEYASNHPASFDVITCMEMLEHVPNPASVITAISQLLKPGGNAFISTLNRTWQCYLQAILMGEYVLRIIPLLTHDYDKFIRPSELETWLHTEDMHLTELTGMAYNPFTRRAWLTSNVQVNYLVACRKR